jgi:hypothetical protein
MNAGWQGDSIALDVPRIVNSKRSLDNFERGISTDDELRALVGIQRCPQHGQLW